MEHIHPLVVHFPIALLLTALFLDIVGLIFKNEKINWAAGWNLILGALGALAAVIAGFIDSGILSGRAPSGHLTVHLTLGIITMVLALLLAMWRLTNKGYLPNKGKAVFLGLMSVMAALVIATAYLGGELVYGEKGAHKHGAASHSEYEEGHMGHRHR